MELPMVAITGVILIFQLADGQDIHRITEEELQVIGRAVNQSRDFLDVVLQEPNNFDDVLDSFNRTLEPWVHGFKAFANVMMLFEAWEEEKASEIRGQYHDLNVQLEEARISMIPAMDTIDWKTVYIDFHEIIMEIQLLEGKLVEVLFTTIRDHGVAEYVRFYEKWYKDAGRRLFESIVDNEGHHRFNVLDAVLMYNPTNRRTVNNFMQGLMVLTMRAAAIELAYERCWEHDRGMDKIWVTRLQEIWEIMLAKDTFMKDTAWLGFKDEANKLAEDNAGLTAEKWSEQVFDYFIGKYYWRVWYVQSLPANSNAAVSNDSISVHRKFNYFGRTLVVMTEEFESEFDLNATAALIEDQTCVIPDAQCFINGPSNMFELLPNERPLKIVMDEHEHSVVRSSPERIVKGRAVLSGSTKHHIFNVIYSG